MENVTLSSDQLQAVELGKKWWNNSEKFNEPLVITGAAGTGKSTMLSQLLETLGISPKHSLFVATSATAVTNVHRKNPTAGASTIASFIKTHNERLNIFDNDENMVEQWTSPVSIMLSEIKGLNSDAIFTDDIIKDDDIATTDVAKLNKILGTLGYYAEREQTFDIAENITGDENHKAVIIDELGMVSNEEMNAILAKRVPVIATGDPYQLPPIGAEQTPYILNEDYKWHFELTEIHRQSDDSGLITLATVARTGGAWKREASALQKAGASGVIIMPSIRTSAKLLSYSDVILASTNRDVEYYNQVLHEYKFGENAPLSVGDRIIVTANTMSRSDATKLPVLTNGQFGTIKRIYENNELASEYALLVDAELDGRLYKNLVVNTRHIEDPRISPYRLKDLSNDDLELYRLRHGKVYQRRLERYGADLSEVVYIAYGYAMTVHKAQGKEWNNVIFDTDMPRAMAENAQPLIYTAITRAKEKLLLV